MFNNKICSDNIYITYLARRIGLVEHQKYKSGRVILVIIIEGNLAGAEFELDSLDVTTVILCNEYQLVRAVSKHALKQFGTYPQIAGVIGDAASLRPIYQMRASPFTVAIFTDTYYNVCPLCSRRRLDPCS